MKAKQGQTISTITPISYYTKFGPVTIPQNTRLTVMCRKPDDTGVYTDQVHEMPTVYEHDSAMDLSWETVRRMHYIVKDTEYIIIVDLNQLPNADDNDIVARYPNNNV